MKAKKILLVMIISIELAVIGFLSLNILNPEVQRSNNYYERNPSLESKGLTESSFKIAAVGDSHTAGDFPNKSKAWPRRLEMELNENFKKQYKVLNYGRHGNGIRNKVETISDMNITPNLLILQLSYDDPIDTDVYRDKVYEFRRKNNIDESRNQTLLRFENNLRARMRKNSAAEAEQIYRQGFQNLSHILSDDTEVLVLQFRSPKSRKKWLKPMVERKGWEYLYWDDFYRDRVSNEEELYKSETNHHYVPRGHEIWAEELFNHLVESRWIKSLNK